MNNQQLALLISQYAKALDKGLDEVCEKIPEHREVRNLLPNFSLTEYTVYPVLDPVYNVVKDMMADAERLEHVMMTVESPEPKQPQPKKGKDIITFEGRYIDFNGTQLGVHDLLMYARSILRHEAGRDIEIARLKVALEDVIEGNQNSRGIDSHSHMLRLENGKET